MKKYTFLWTTKHHPCFITVKGKNAEEAVEKVRKITMEDQDVYHEFRNRDILQGQQAIDFPIVKIEEL